MSTGCEVALKHIIDKKNIVIEVIEANLVSSLVNFSPVAVNYK